MSDKAQASLSRVIEKFKRSDLSAIRSVARIRLDPKAPASSWSFTNRVLAFTQAQELDCRAYGQWKEVGRSIKKGCNAVYIVRPVTIPIQNQENDENKQRLCVGFSTIPVFAASNTQGVTSIPTYQPTQLPPLIDVAAKFHIAVEFVPLVSNRLGDSSVDGSKIRVGTKEESVFFHELAHAIHAKLVGSLQGGQHENQETVAEFTATVLMDVYGLCDHSGNAWKYISQYSDNPLVAITKALSTVEKVLHVLFE